MVHVSVRFKEHRAVTHIERDESEDDAQVAPMITVFNVEPRVHVLISSPVWTVLTALCSFGVREVSAREFHEGAHVLAAREFIRGVDAD